MHTSPAGRALVERNEGLRLTAYPDPATGGDPWTVGYGDTGSDVVPGLVITKEDADRRLSNRLSREFEPAVNHATTVPTTQAQFDAMVSLAYNIGTGGFGNSSVLRHHLAGDHQAAADAFLLWNRAAGRVLPALTRRRAEERALYLSDAAPAVAPAPPAPSVPIPSAREMQTTLAALGFDPGGIDGVWGTRSAAALAAYLRQRA